MRNLLASTAALGLALLASAPQEARAQSPEKKTAVSLSFSPLQYRGDFGTEFWDRDRMSNGYGLSVNRYLNPGMDLGLLFNYGDLIFRAGNNNPYRGSSFDNNVINANLGLKLKLNNGWALKEDALIAPYLLIAPGVMIQSTEGNVNGTPFDKNVTAFDIFGAAGIKVRLGETFSVFAQTGQHYPLTDRIDNVVLPETDLYDRYLQHTFGVTINLGKAKDTDQDGVSDRKDKCPDTPAGVAVDEAGCPLDGDKDGVPDYQDKCPTEAGTTALEGCPDKDGDSVRDSEDECPDQPGTPALRGCPDADNDGVADKNDKCPDTPAGTQVDATGCPVVVDADGDGILDNVDKCAGTPANVKVDSTGCPLPIPAEIRKLEQPVRFETNSTVIKRSSYPALNKMIKVLEEHPEYALRITGHADSRGTDEYNQALSERRAASAKTYFTGKNVDPNRIVTEGFGESRPAGNKKTAAGMAKNRRAEFKFEFYIPSQPQP